MDISFPRIDDPQWWEDKLLPPDEAFKWFAAYGCSWSYKGEPSPERPHAELSGGKCSSAYYNFRELFTKNPRLCAIFAGQLVRKLREAELVGSFDCVVGSSYSAITVSYEVAKILGVFYAFTEKEKDLDDPKKTIQVWKGNIPAGSRILQVEEVITTLKTGMQVREAILGSNAHPVEFLPNVAVILHRPAELPIDYGDEWKIISFLEEEVWAGKLSECRYCEVGSERVSPRANWARLTGKA